MNNSTYDPQEIKMGAPCIKKEVKDTLLNIILNKIDNLLLDSTNIRDNIQGIRIELVGNYPEGPGGEAKSTDDKVVTGKFNIIIDKLGRLNNIHQEILHISNDISEVT